jgi:hypothetical protein
LSTFVMRRKSGQKMSICLFERSRTSVVTEKVKLVKDGKRPFRASNFHLSGVLLNFFHFFVEQRHHLHIAVSMGKEVFIIVMIVENIYVQIVFMKQYVIVIVSTMAILLRNFLRNWVISNVNLKRNFDILDRRNKQYRIKRVH